MNHDWSKLTATARVWLIALTQVMVTTVLLLGIWTSSMAQIGTKTLATLGVLLAILNLPSHLAHHREEPHAEIDIDALNEAVSQLREVSQPSPPARAPRVERAVKRPPVQIEEPELDDEEDEWPFKSLKNSDPGSPPSEPEKSTESTTESAGSGVWIPDDAAMDGSSNGGFAPSVLPMDSNGMPRMTGNRS